MAKGANQKLKLLYILKILSEKSDKNHPISTQRLISMLEEVEISAERKSIYDDIKQLNQFGYAIEQIKSKDNGGYYLQSRELELAELKLLVDAVQASKYISAKKSQALIKKLEKFVSHWQAKELNRQVYVSNRVKTENQELYNVVDVIHQAIQNNHQIQFQYMTWNFHMELVPRKNGQLYRISPFALTCKDENYYLIAYDSNYHQIRHYRVDKMEHTVILSDTVREGNESFECFDLAAYANQSFGMFGGKEEIVTLTGDLDMVGVIMDRFGKNISLRKKDDGFSARVQVTVSDQFFGWVSGLSTKVQIAAPATVVNDYKAYIEKILSKYQ